jgi:hypothetical protein
MWRRLPVMMGLLGIAVLAPNRPLLAHHSTAAYSPNEITLKGTVVEYDWGNPHVLIVWDSKDDSGNVVRWSGELASVSSLLADGMTKDSLKVGDDVIMTVRPAKAGTPHSVVDQIKRGDGTMVLRWSRQGGGTAEERAARDAARKSDNSADGQN